MTAGGSHTNFDSGAFSVGAVGSAAALAGALAAGFQNYRQAQRDRWANWTVAQLQSALDCSETMRFAVHNELNATKARVVELERQLADRAFVFKREQARRSRAQR